MSSTTGHRPQGTTRLVLVLLAAAVATTALGRRAWTLLPDGIGQASAMPVDRAIELVVLGVGSLAAAWLTLSAVVGIVYVAAGRLGLRWRAGEALLDRAAPAVVRRLARSAVGLGVGAGLALAPTAALAADAEEPGPAGAPASVVLDLGWQPASDVEDVPPAPDLADTTVTADADASADVDVEAEADVDVEAGPDVEADAEGAGPAPVSHDVLSSATRDTPHDEDDDTRVVLRGDTLWDIAAESLDGAPSDADVLREMTRWHEVNRDVVGDDPDLILPGQVLRTPG